MNIAIGTIAIIVGLLCVGGGALSFFGGMRSDDPTAGNEAGSKGCIAAAIGLALIGFAIWRLVA